MQRQPSICCSCLGYKAKFALRIGDELLLSVPS
jgi:hypothetical protein